MSSTEGINGLRKQIFLFQDIFLLYQNFLMGFLKTFSILCTLLEMTKFSPPMKFMEYNMFCVSMKSTLDHSLLLTLPCLIFLQTVFLSLEDYGLSLFPAVC